MVAPQEQEASSHPSSTGTSRTPRTCRARCQAPWAQLQLLEGPLGCSKKRIKGTGHIDTYFGEDKSGVPWELTRGIPTSVLRGTERVPDEGHLSRDLPMGTKGSRSSGAPRAKALHWKTSGESGEREEVNELARHETGRRWRPVAGSPGRP